MTEDELEEAIREIMEICEDTPEGSKQQILDDALTDIYNICEDVITEIEACEGR